MKKYDDTVVMFLVFIPISIFLLGLLNILIITNYTKGFIFMTISAVIALIIYLILHTDRKSSKIVGELKKNNTYVMLNVEKVEEIDGILDIIASTKKNKVKYTFSTTYLSPEEKWVKLINKKMKENNVKTIKVWVDLDSYEYFEYDIDGFMKKLNLDNKLELVGWGATDDPDGFED